MITMPASDGLVVNNGRWTSRQRWLSPDSTHPRPYLPNKNDRTARPKAQITLS